MLIRVKRLHFVLYSHFPILSDTPEDPVQSLVNKRAMCFMKGNSFPNQGHLYR